MLLRLLQANSYAVRLKKCFRARVRTADREFFFHDFLQKNAKK
jgi:hypothetical protein